MIHRNTIISDLDREPREFLCREYEIFFSEINIQRYRGKRRKKRKILRREREREREKVKRNRERIILRREKNILEEERSAKRK